MVVSAAPVVVPLSVVAVALVLGVIAAAVVVASAAGAIVGLIRAQVVRKRRRQDPERLEVIGGRLDHLDGESALAVRLGGAR